MAFKYAFSWAVLIGAAVIVLGAVMLAGCGAEVPIKQAAICEECIR